MRINPILLAIVILFFCSCQKQGTVLNITLSQVEKELKDNKKTDLSLVWKSLKLGKDELKRLPKFEQKDLNQKSWYELAKCEITSTKGDRYKILKANGSPGYIFVFIFIKTETDWVFLEKIISYDKYEIIDVMASNVEDDAILLSVSKMITSGKGIYKSNLLFYRYKGGKIKQVLEILRKGRVINWGWMFEREFNSSVEMLYDAKIDEIKITYNIKYYNSPAKGYPDKRMYNNMPLFNVKKSVYYIWDANNEKYRFDNFRSEIPEEQIDEIFTGGDKELYKQYKKEIEALKNSEIDYQREWALKIINAMSK